MRVIGRRQWPLRWPDLLLIGALTACGGSERDTAPENGDWPPAQLTVHNRAVALMGQFKYADATVLLETLAKQRPSDPMVATDLAIGILNRQQPGDPERALSLTEEVLKRYPDNRRAAYVSGLLYLYLGDLASATDRFQRVVSGDAADGHAHYFLGQSLLQSGAPQQALARFEQAVAAEPYLRSGYYGAFQALRTIGGAEQRQQELLAAYQKLERNPRAMLAEFKYTRMGPKATLRAIRLADETEKPPPGPLFVEPQTLWESAAGPGPASSITLVDLDGNGLLDIFITSDGDDTRNLLLLRDPDGSLQPAADLPFLTSGAVRAAYWGDIDYVGDTDLYLARRGANELWVKEGPVWQESATAAGVAGDGLDSVGGALFDADHDGDLDLFIVNADGPNELYSNNLDGSFRRLAVKQGIDGGDRATLGVVPADLDNDRDLDLLVIHRVPPHEVFINDRLWNYHSGGDAFADLAGAPLRAAAAMDNDVDGVPEIYGQLADGELVRWVVSETGSWGRDPLGRADPTQGPHLALFDITGDGQAEIITTDGDGWSAHASNSEATGQRLLARGTQATVWTLAPLGPAGGPAALGWFERRLRVWRPGSGRGNYLTVAPSGKSDSAQTMRSNASGIGTRLRARHGGRWSSAGGVGADSGPGQSLQPVSLGIGTAGQADFLELEWSDGVYQTELDLVAGITHRITETQRQLSSCPVMFAWDG
ncbi:MAG: FG-GAP-like repeat-containing protein, partial [Pseudomonadota bacterium]|nr:FG-GAP-like repeat-containing protein [Pseudomonadota bacterium]